MRFSAFYSAGERPPNGSGLRGCSRPLYRRLAGPSAPNDICYNRLGLLTRTNGARMGTALVAVIMGSASDRETMQGCLEILERLSIPHEVHVMSAHRQAEKVRQFGLMAREQGFEGLIAGAGGAAALPGALASWTTLPVIGVPLQSSELKGVDALYSIAQMPPGVPVATVAVGSWGAHNAALLAAEILALKHEDIRRAYEDYRKEQASG